MMLLWILMGCPARATSPSMRVMSAMFPPSSVPTPIAGSPFIADKMLMKPSGSEDTSATRMKLVTNSVNLRNLAMWATDLTAYSALLTSSMQPMMKMSASLYMTQI